MPYIAAFDLGTSGLKLSMIDGDGRLRGSWYAAYPVTVPGLGMAEQDAGCYWEAVCRTSGQMWEGGGVRREEVAAVIFAAQWKGIIPIDSRGAVLRRSILWLDHRAGEEAEELNRLVGERYFSAGDYLPKVLWLVRHEPDCLERCEKLLDAGSYLKYRAAGTLTWDLTSHFTRSPVREEQALWDRALEYIGVPGTLFPPVAGSGETVGGVTAAAAAETGFLAGTPIMGGCGDIPAITAGVGPVTPGQAHIYLGSSGWFAAVGEAGSPIRDARKSAFSEQYSIYFRGLEAAGLTAQWLRERLYAGCAGAKEQMEAEIRRTPPGSSGLLGIPSLYGESAPFGSALTGSWVGLRGCHTRGDLARSMLEGICCYLRFHRDFFEQAGCRHLSAIRVCGGCANSGAWMQMLADLLEIPVEVPEENEYIGALGAAKIAWQGLRHRVPENAPRAAVYLPAAENTWRYRQVYEKHSSLRRVLEAVQAELE